MAYSGDDTQEKRFLAFSSSIPPVLIQIPEDLPDVHLKEGRKEEEMQSSVRKFNEVLGRTENPLTAGQMIYVLDINWDRLSKSRVIVLTGNQPGVIKVWRSAYDLPDAPDYELGESLPESEKDPSPERGYSVDELLSKIFGRRRLSG